ncbi:ATP-grasp domain-containing protein [Spiribacter aquaticus]|uniref:ATP-grasp domain-containing protein n=1 Tax=Spiribacter aquaticus TaxID=1935996 RepID=A0A557RNF5_9GAMM|nr:MULTISPECIES: ATP-grasp domain-containing protein [Spiribacter]TVO66709.1 ATP-grasp domain-containing protein [Spiribacter aquaticus]
MSSQPEAWVFNCDYNGLSVIQSLGRAGVVVRALDAHRAIGTRSRYARYSSVPDPLVDEDGFIKALWRLREAVDSNPILVPTNDHWAEAIARHRAVLSEGFECCVCQYETVSLVLDKERFGYWGKSVGLPVPQVWQLEEARGDAEIPFPIGVKPNVRRSAGQGSFNARAADQLRFRRCVNRPELDAVLCEAEQADVHVFLQEIIEGRSDAMRTIGVYAVEGRLLGIVYGKKKRGFPPGSGDCVVGVAEEPPKWAIDLAEKSCAALHYTGIAELEVMQDSVSMHNFLIEINPRSWSWIGVSQPAGSNLPLLAYNNLAFGQEPAGLQVGCRDGEPVYYAKLLGDLQNTLLWYRFSDSKDWVLNFRGWWGTFAGKRGVFAEFAQDDLPVAIFSVVQAAKQFIRRARRVLGGERF